ncbi:MAG TPA: hypothetical protein VL132_19995, partial [Planctomycetaceae bacterium]|nr:hypothetical protein [Planctomycetaceae bacterium]
MELAPDSQRIKAESHVDRSRLWAQVGIEVKRDSLADRFRKPFLDSQVPKIAAFNWSLHGLRDLNHGLLASPCLEPRTATAVIAPPIEANTNRTSELERSFAANSFQPLLVGFIRRREILLASLAQPFQAGEFLAGHRIAQNARPKRLLNRGGRRLSLHTERPDAELALSFEPA